MLKLGLIVAKEASLLFSDVHLLIPVHKELVDNLERARLPDGRSEEVGLIILEWVPQLVVYIVYCTGQILAKEFLDSRTKSDPAFRDFLERCLTCPFSRKLDLWTFLDVPRSRLVKYPLLFRGILKNTPLGHLDHLLLCESLEAIEEVIRDVDFNAGLAKCQHIVSKLEYEYPSQMNPLIGESSIILCDGILKTRKGTKLHVFLLDKILVLTRPTSKCGSASYRVYRMPIPLTSLCLVEEALTSTKCHVTGSSIMERNVMDGESSILERKDSGFSSPGPKMLRNVLSSLSQHNFLSLGQTTKGHDLTIELMSSEEWSPKSKRRNSGNKSRYLFRMEDELDRQHWLRCLRTCITGRPEPDLLVPKPGEESDRRREGHHLDDEPNRIPAPQDLGLETTPLLDSRALFNHNFNEAGRGEGGQGPQQPHIDCSELTDSSSYSSFMSLSDSSFSSRYDFELRGICKGESQDESPHRPPHPPIAAATSNLWKRGRGRRAVIRMSTRERLGLRGHVGMRKRMRRRKKMNKEEEEEDE